MRRTSVFCCILALCLVALPALAGEGRIPVWRSPTVIAAPGQYVLTRHILPNPLGGPAIDIVSHDVDLDLNGFSVSNAGVPAPAIHVALPERVRIHNGFIDGGTDNIAAPGGGTKIVIEKIKARNANIGFNLIGVETVVIRDCLITATEQDAIRIDGNPWKNGQVERNVIKTVGAGIYVSAGSSLILRLNQIENVASPSGLVVGPGIRLISSHGVLLDKNTIESAQGGGIELGRSTGCKLNNNVIKEVGGFGIILDEASLDNYLLHNVVTGTILGDGILVDGSRNHLDDNLSNGNALCGIHFTNTANFNVYRKNVARGNTCPLPAPCAVVSTTDFCDDGPGNSTNNDNFLPFTGM